MRRRRFLAALGLAPAVAKTLDLDDVLETAAESGLATSPDELVDVELGEALAGTLTPVQLAWAPESLGNVRHLRGSGRGTPENAHAWRPRPS